MCGRYAQYRDGDRLRKLFATVNPLPNLQPSWNVAPTRLAPVVLETVDFPHWLGEAPGDVAALLRPSAAGFRVWQVGAAVGNVRNDGEDLLQPVS